MYTNARACKARQSALHERSAPTDHQLRCRATSTASAICCCCCKVGVPNQAPNTCTTYTPQPPGKKEAKCEQELRPLAPLQPGNPQTAAGQCAPTAANTNCNRLHCCDRFKAPNRRKVCILPLANKADTLLSPHATQSAHTGTLSGAFCVLSTSG